MYPLIAATPGSTLPLDSLKGAPPPVDTLTWSARTELVDTSHRVATANERECAVFSSLYNSIGYRTRTGSKVVELEYTSRAVPAIVLEGSIVSANLFASLRTCVKTFPSVGYVVAGAYHCIAFCIAQCVAGNAIGTKNEG